MGGVLEIKIEAVQEYGGSDIKELTKERNELET